MAASNCEHASSVGCYLCRLLKLWSIAEIVNPWAEVIRTRYNLKYTKYHCIHNWDTFSPLQLENVNYLKVKASIRVGYVIAIFKFAVKI